MLHLSCIACRSGDFFKAHVDTPRENLLGSLVICLPHVHAGGALAVRHRDQQACSPYAQLAHLLCLKVASTLDHHSHQSSCAGTWYQSPPVVTTSTTY